MLIDTFFSVGAIPKGNAYFRQGSGRIWLDDLNCNGSETDIAFCGHRGWGRTNCDHSEDASVICNGKFNFISSPIGLTIAVSLTPRKV